MAFTLVGYTESQDTSNALTAVAALADPHVTINGDDIIIPELNQLLGIYASGTTITRAQLRSPSLRRVVNLEVILCRWLTASPAPLLRSCGSGTTPSP